MTDKLTQHELIVRLKDMAIDLGRTPTRDEFRKAIRQEKSIRELGGYSVLVHAAGLAPSSTSKKIDSSIFEVSIDKHLEEYRPRPIGDRKPYPRIAIISDIHFPFQCQRVLDAFYAFIKQHRPEYVILNGDAIDFYSHSRFPKSHNVFTPREEQDLARKGNELFWKSVKSSVPDAKCKQLLGNHSLRPMKQVLSVYPEIEDWVAEGLKKLLTFDGVDTIFDHREELIIGDIAIHHGYRSKLGDARDFTLMNCCSGHSHKGGVSFRTIKGSVLWELNSGFAGDPESKGLTYTNQRLSDWTPGFGFIWEWGPQFIPA